jgi:hypothetical protein
MQMFKWLKKLWDWATLAEISQKLDQYESQLKIQELKQAKPKRPRLYKQATVVTTGELPKAKEKKMATKPGLYANIHAKQERIEKQKASGAKKVETMRKPGTKGAPTAAAFKQSAKTAKAKK